MVKVVVDAFGGDNAPDEIILGVSLALQENSELSIVLVGDEVILSKKIEEFNLDKTRIEIVDAQEVITNDESPTVAIRSKANSTIVKGFEQIRTREDVAGFVTVEVVFFLRPKNSIRPSAIAFAYAVWPASDVIIA